MLDWIGWLATAISAGSYLCKRPVMLRRTQALAALLWIGYGTVIRSFPLVAANLIVGFAGAYSSLRPDADSIAYGSSKNGGSIHDFEGDQTQT